MVRGVANSEVGILFMINWLILVHLLIEFKKSAQYVNITGCLFIPGGMMNLKIFSRRENGREN